MKSTQFTVLVKLIFNIFRRVFFLHFGFQKLTCHKSNKKRNDSICFVMTYDQQIPDAIFLVIVKCIHNKKSKSAANGANIWLWSELILNLLFWKHLKLFIVLFTYLDRIKIGRIHIPFGIHLTYTILTIVKCFLLY